ncbi:hypothetical protein CLAIMM_02489 [Cladophialophora immunda]|nr:hypothetical protein CLAIMM_02489 [Cladophialophora immunda]
MCCNDSHSTPTCKHAPGDKGSFKSAITEARRQQNRRAQRAFRERRRAKNRLLSSTRQRPLAPYPHEFEADANANSSDTGILNQSTVGPETLIPSHRYQEHAEGVQDRPDPNCGATKEAPFTFSSPQTLLPTHQSLIPKLHTPFSELLNLVRDRPAAALWPHGVTTTLAACLFNARALGIDIERVMDPQYMSPFYQTSVSPILISGLPGHSTNNIIALNQQSSVPGSLRPCSAQVMFPHHVCIDMLPLPRLRETAVMLNVLTQHAGADRVLGGIDRLQELKKDVYIRQGVRFRGRGQLTEGEYITYDESGRHCGNPWERGSWAVAPWFAKKWTCELAMVRL